MNISIIIGLLLIIPFGTAFDDDFYAPVLPKPRISPSDLDDPAPIFLGRDPYSGCLCRESPKKWIVCFGRDLCKKFPKNLKSDLVDLRIKGTKMDELKNGDLVNWSQLTSMRIEGDNNLNKIESGVFGNMTNLTNLSISYCPNLRSLNGDTFVGLFNLRELYLVQNGFGSLLDVTPALSPNVLGKIEKLVLNENYFREIDKDDFVYMKGSSLRELNLVLCQIEYVHPESLGPLRNLNALRLGENAFNTTTLTELVEYTIGFGIPLKLLNLYSVGLRKNLPKDLLMAIALSNITNLCLARNQFEIIKDSSFPSMPNLEILDLREVLVLNITKNAFGMMPKLRTLLLSGNKLTTVPEGVLLAQLTYLDLSANSGNLFFPSYFSLGEATFKKMSNLQLLNLSFNRVTSLRNYTFLGLENLLVLGLKNATIFFVEDNSFGPLQNLLLLNLENNPLGKNHPLRKNMFLGLRKLQVLLLGGCSISYIDLVSPFKHLVSLRHLGLEKNNIHVLFPTTFLPLKKLETLDLSANTIGTWHEPLFTNTKNLTKITATHNKITFLSDAMLDDFDQLSFLDISENPLTCDCTTFLYFTNRTNTTILKLLETNPPFCVYPDFSKNLTITEYLKQTEENPTICESDKKRLVLIVAMPLVFLAAILSVSAILLYVYRFHVRYWVFLTRLYLSRRGKIRPKTDKRSHTNYEYDAFVSYSNEDRNFVIRLVGMLENYEPYLKLCVYERDFQIGSVISESVLESVVKSRKTVLIISDSYARSQWCRWEAQIAEHHRLFFENDQGDYVDDSLILIKLGPVSESHITPTLKYLLKTRIYLQWDSDTKKQKIFWEKLRNALAPPKKQCGDDGSDVIHCSYL